MAEGLQVIQPWLDAGNKIMSWEEMPEIPGEG